MTALPFTQTLQQDRKQWRIMGIVSIALDGLQVEWRADEYEKTWNRTYRHAGRGQTHVVVLPWTVLDAVTFHGGLIRDSTLRVRARTMNALDALPGADGPFWSARVERPERTRARELALAAEAAIGASLRLLSHPTRA